MAGGTFTPGVSKIRPGTYINFESVRPPVAPRQRGIVLIPLINHDYGPAKEFISISSEAADAKRSMLGHSVMENNPNMLLIYEAFKCSA